MLRTMAVVRPVLRVVCRGPAVRALTRRSHRGRALVLLTALSVGMLPAISAPSASAAAKASAKKLTKVTIVLPAITTTFLAFFVGQYDGIYRKYGLTVTLQKITVQAMIPAVLGGQAQFVGAVGDIFNPTVQHLKILEASSLYAPFALVGAKNVTSLQQLKGQTIAGGGGLNGQPDNYIRVVMTKAGMPPSTYSVAEVSSDAGGRFDAVEAGKAAAAPVDLNYLVAPPVEGWPVLAKGKVFLSMGAGLLTSTTLIKSKSSMVKRMVEATAKATALGYTNEKAAVKAWKLGTASEHYTYTNAEWDQIWKLEKPIFSPNGHPTAANVSSYLTLLKTSQKLPAIPTKSQVFDLKFLPKK